MERVNLKKKQEPSKDYHDYVFKNGKLIGDFEGMYRHSDGVPWHQNKQAKWIDVRLTKELLKDLKPFDEIHDYGCGLGYYLDLIHKILGGADKMLWVRYFTISMSESKAFVPQTHFPNP